MIFLLTQMTLVVIAAVVLGLALGWLLHRSTHSHHVHDLKQTIRKQRTQVAQAHSEVTMLTDDYNELKSNTHDQISSLQHDNQQIPSLLDNLEKSQLLVQQNMKRHEARLRDVNTENQKLEEQLNAIKQGNSATSENDSSEDASNSNAETTDNNDSSPTRQTGGYAAAESENDPFDQVMEVEDGFQLDLDQTNDTAAVASLDDTISSSKPVANFPGTGQMQIDALLDDAESEQSENSTASTDSSAPRFAPSSTQDDLQQIFGIGPLTEKALNDLGITSYSQLAQLEKHDIAHIADALEIGPGRIERDNWVGNARKQLEEVLEQL